MAKKNNQRGSESTKEVDFNDESLKEAMNKGDSSLLPSGIVIRSPYGEAPYDVASGAPDATGDARGADGNTGAAGV